jgi:hypothetical protein
MVAASHSGIEYKFETLHSGGDSLRPPIPSSTVASVSIYRYSSTTIRDAGGLDFLASGTRRWQE